MGCIFSSHQKNKIDLVQYNINNTSKFSLNKLFTDARVVDIYDGDTCTCIIPLFDSCYQFTIRLADIDTCEIKSKNIENKQLALEARKLLCQLISDDFNNIDCNITRKELSHKLNEKSYIIKLKCGEFDKYGRLLGLLYNKDALVDISIDESFNHIMINKKLAYQYEGKTKLTEEEQIDLLKNK